MDQALYVEKQIEYFDQLRKDVIVMIPKSLSGAKVLEIGCGRGHTLIALKRMGIAAEVVGVELVALPEDSPEFGGIDRYIVANVETEELDLPEEYFDVIICADVLEHLINPWRVMESLRKYLKPGGVIVASIPNVREVRTLLNIVVRGDFPYSDDGVLDRTHLRFFCKKNMLALLTSSECKVEAEGSDLYIKSNWRANLNRWSLGLLEQFLITQYVFLVRKHP
jgi:2-polyprenyl-3-methyl-5-hydroxy-6-metoxy-1,4-benzoquinol methylase